MDGSHHMQLLRKAESGCQVRCDLLQAAGRFLPLFDVVLVAKEGEQRLCRRLLLFLQR